MLRRLDYFFFLSVLPFKSVSRTYSFLDHSSARKRSSEVLNDSDLSAVLNSLGLRCSEPDTFMSPETDPRSSLVMSLIEGCLYHRQNQYDCQA